ncbi:hypothetical protein [Legionella waltersii]|uniref:Uncharacterized protein n=1 Tax=Legionella waltersii TaxID=66969 RepID=A0A0W1A5C6_9GAMM|nr:hypothetical protein [Legionella waltersii]KTD76572.1 hypothetical protein Lwal_2294 [Legionella waltersii]SNU94226.1 Uncharacterised protein [Legionella waltersii]
MKRILVILMMSLCFATGYTSKLSKFLNKMDSEQKQRDAQEWQQDMNFGDFMFRLQQRYTDNHGQRCRDYEFRARSNPYKHGYYTICDER